MFHSNAIVMSWPLIHFQKSATWSMSASHCSGRAAFATASKVGTIRTSIGSISDMKISQNASIR